jgi:PKD repeat protein
LIERTAANALVAWAVEAAAGVGAEAAAGVAVEDAAGFAADDTVLCSAPFTVNFTNQSTGTGAINYVWNFGDGNTGNGIVVSHTYTAPGNFTVSCLINNNTPQTCTLTSALSITIPCLSTAVFSHTVGANGLVAFSSLNNVTYSTTTYAWDFGDGYGDIAPNPFHQYANAGTHYVKFTVGNSANASCGDTLIQAINITGITCSANAVFSLAPSTIPQVWYAVPFYPYNVTAASWNWGDGSSSNTMYASHTYSAAGTYSICLSVTVSCNSTASYCFSQYLNKPWAGGMPVNINVIPPATKVGLQDFVSKKIDFEVWPSPANNYVLFLSSDIISNAEVLDLSGRTLFKQKLDAVEGKLDLSALSSGCYIIRFETPATIYTKKILVRK